VTAGVDWASDDHAVCVAGDQGEVPERFTVSHDAAGLRQLRAHLETPSTRQSGKVKPVTFRWGAGKQLRDALCDFAGDSRRASPRATGLYDKAIARGCDHPHPVRILARVWDQTIWRCWQDHAACDPAAHNSLQALLNHDQPIAA
jgi:hypothetical protein